MRFCGMVNYLNTLCPNLSQVIKPLLYLRKQDREFIWSDVHQEAFAKAKHLIASAPCVAYFNNKRPVTLQVDASQGGPGGALLQPNDSGDLQPVAHTSCKLRPNKKVWAQIEPSHSISMRQVGPLDLWQRSECAHRPLAPRNYIEEASTLRTSPPSENDDAAVTLQHQSYIQEGYVTHAG